MDNLIVCTPEQLRSIIREELKRLQSSFQVSSNEDDKLLTIEELIDYLPEKPARQTIYGKINNRSIPYEKYGKRCYFRKSHIDKWLNNGRQMKGL